jgi:TonB family protein
MSLLCMRTSALGWIALLFQAPIAPGSASPESPMRVVLLHYPCLALKAKIQGPVRVRCVIAQNGTCGDVKPVAGHPLLLPDALDNLKQWRYRPAKASPQRSVRSVEVEYRFEIRGVRTSKEQSDVEVTFDAPNIVNIVSPFDEQVPCKVRLLERPIG